MTTLIRTIGLENQYPSAEHVEYVLSRLKQTPAPVQVETGLEVSEAPVADTERPARGGEPLRNAYDKHMTLHTPLVQLA